MATTTTQLQQLIEKEAEKSLRSELHSLFAPVNDYLERHKVLWEKVTVSGASGTGPVAAQANLLLREIEEAICRARLPKVIQQETEQFFYKVAKR